MITDYKLNQNYPNPFNPVTNISFDLASQEFIQLKIYSSLGQEVRSLANGFFPAGSNHVQWDSKDNLGQTLPAGVYYYHLNAGSFQAARKMLLIK